jgi:hypothetical protein
LKNAILTRGHAHGPGDCVRGLVAGGFWRRISSDVVSAAYHQDTKGIGSEYLQHMLGDLWS